MIGKGTKLNNVKFQTRVRDESIEGPNPYRWETKTTDDFFKGKRVVIFSLPGAFTPTCSTYQLPGYEENVAVMKELGVDNVYCISVNDAFVMNAWGRHQKIENIELIPDGNGEFTQGLGMLVDKSHLGFGKRSWRFSAVVNDGVVEQAFVEPGKNDVGSDSDPYEVTDPETMLAYLKSVSIVSA